MAKIVAYLFVFVRFFIFVLAVDRSQFRTCDDSSFCKRHRHYKPSLSPYEVVGNSVRLQDNSLNVVLENTLNKRQLSLKISSFGDSRIGIAIDEENGIKQRFRVTEPFAKTPIRRGFRENKIDKTTTSVTTVDGQKVIVQHQPFRLDVFDKNDLVLTLNSEGLLKYEHYRPKPIKEEKNASETEGLNDADKVEHHADDNGDDATPTTTESNEEPSKTGASETTDPDQNETVDGMWDENWRSHFDSKPFGPSSIGLDISLIGFKHAFGLPEHADSFVLKSTSHSDPYRMYNLDVAEYELNNPMALYGAIPYIMGHSASRTVGVLWLNAAETWIDIKNSVADKSMFRNLLDRFKSEPEVPQIDTHWMSESGIIDVYLFFGPKPVDVFRQYTDFFGVTNLPPYFSIAYHQCRWNYNDMDDVKQVDANFDVHDIPYDVLWLDIEHTDGKKYFTWDPNKFSDPKSMVDNLVSKGRKLVTIVDPHIKRDDNYKIYKDAKELNYFVKNRDGADYEGWCWPGSSMYLDFLNPEVQNWWAQKYSFDEYEGSSENVFIWNDMNEPSVFNGPEVTMYKDCKHFGGWEHRDIHNMYGFYNHMSTFKGLLKRTNAVKRPFILTRSFFVGSQKYAAVWTGDNTADWSHLQITFPMLLSLGVGGIPFVGADVGGFFKNPEEELLTRWYQMGAFNPFFRAHAHLDTRRREPWLFSNETKMLIREAIRRRYIMLPYWYTLFYEHMMTGLPILRPLWLEFPNDISSFDEEKEAMIGRAILARPVVDKGESSVSVYLPGEGSIWYDWDTFKPQPGPGAVTVKTPMDKIPVFIRGGTIIPLKMRIRRSSSLSKHDPITLYIALNFEGTFANGTLYVDDGETFEYNKGVHCYRLFEYTGDDATGSITNKKISGDLCKTDVWLEKIIVLGVNYRPKEVLLYTTPENPTSLAHNYDAGSRSLTIRKPGMKINVNFRLEIHS